MPHNRTRLWVGLAIAAVSIPAVGTFYYYSSATHDLRGHPIAAYDRFDASSRLNDSFGVGRLAIHRPARDYQAEVDAALARQGAVIPREDPTVSDDPIFNVDPLYFDDEPTPDDVAPITDTSRAGSYTQQLTADETVATDGNNADDGNGQVAQGDATVAEDDEGPAQTTANAASGDLSDDSIYRMVVANLKSDERADFVRAFAAMTPDQQEDLLDSFRRQIQGGTE